MGKKTKGSAGSRLMAACAEKYLMNPAEQLLLEHAAELADLAERLATTIRAQAVDSVGAAGQPVANPLHRDFYDCTARIAATLDALALPDRPEGKLSTTARAQRAAQARWSRRAG